MTREIYFDFMTLIQNLVRIEDDFCQDKILELNILECIFNLIHDTRYGLHVTMAGLDSLNEIFD